MLLPAIPRFVRAHRDLLSPESGASVDAPIDWHDAQTGVRLLYNGYALMDADEADDEFGGRG